MNRQSNCPTQKLVHRQGTNRKLDVAALAVWVLLIYFHSESQAQYDRRWKYCQRVTPVWMHPLSTLQNMGNRPKNMQHYHYKSSCWSWQGAYCGAFHYGRVSMRIQLSGLLEEKVIFVGPQLNINHGTTSRNKNFVWNQMKYI